MWSVTYCDIYSGWTVNRAAWNKGSAGVVAATRGVQGALPFELLGFDTDNGSHQGSRISMDGEEMKKVGIVPASALSAAFERAFRPEFVGFEQVETPPAQGGEVFLGIALKTTRWLCAELPRHLPNSRAVAAWCGLTPRLRQSGTSLHGTSSIGHEGHRFPRKESSVSFRISTPGLRLSRGGDSRVHPRVLPLRALTGVFKPIGHFVIAYQAAAAERLVVVHTLNARHADVVSHKRTVD